MNTYICLLRGINVSGQKKIKMVELKASFETLGLKDVITYIQSGNIIFKSEENNTVKLESSIHEMLLDDYGFDVKVLVLTPDQMHYAATNNPYEKDSTRDPKKFYVVFLKEKPLQENITVLATYDYSPEEYVLDDKLIYYYAAKGAANAKMSTNFFENKLKVSASARNWRTVNKLVELSN
ncbi:MAG: DUF1697 domain-containing protein [Flavobacteriaceae bacterium]|nr:DUF1697 domain-containing protein [Flavobacteriaceae bacterium]